MPKNDINFIFPWTNNLYRANLHRTTVIFFYDFRLDDIFVIQLLDASFMIHIVCSLDFIRNMC